MWPSLLLLIISTTLLSACSSSELLPVFVDHEENMALWGSAEDGKAGGSRRELVEAQAVYSGCNGLSETACLENPCFWIESAKKCIVNCEEFEKDDCKARKNECIYNSREASKANREEIPKPGCYFKQDVFDVCSDVQGKSQCKFMGSKCVLDGQKCKEAESGPCDDLKKKQCKKQEGCIYSSGKCVIDDTPDEESCDGLKERKCKKTENCVFEDGKCTENVDGGDDGCQDLSKKKCIKKEGCSFINFECVSDDTPDEASCEKIIRKVHCIDEENCKFENGKCLKKDG